jgi:hypothetical protein
MANSPRAGIHVSSDGMAIQFMSNKTSPFHDGNFCLILCIILLHSGSTSPADQGSSVSTPYLNKFLKRGKGYKISGIGFGEKMTPLLTKVMMLRDATSSDMFACHQGDSDDGPSHQELLALHAVVHPESTLKAGEELTWLVWSTLPLWRNLPLVAQPWKFFLSTTA